jgi:hypothetical protein
MRDDSRLQVEVEPLAEARIAKLRSHVLALTEAEARGRVTLATVPPPKRGRVGMIVAFAAAAVIAGLATRAVLERPLTTDSRLVTTESASQFTIGESSLDVAPRSTVLVHGDDAHGVDVVLDRGEVTCEVAPRRGRPAFVVDAGEVRVRVVGTRFAVERDGSGARVRVDHGTVEVTSHGAVTILHDGESWPSLAGAAASGRAPSAAPPASVAGTAPAGASSAIVPLATGAPSALAPSTSAPLTSPTGRKHGRHASTPPESAATTEPAVSALVTPAATAPAPSPLPPPAGPSPREQFEHAARLEASQPSRAADLYRSIADGGGAWAPNALFALARLESDRGRSADAKRLLQSYLTRYPRGQNAEDARALLDRLP